MQEVAVCGLIAVAHQLQWCARWIILLDGSCVGSVGERGPATSRAFVVLERVGASFQLAGFRSGKVYMDDSHPWCLGLGKPRLVGNHWDEHGEVLLVADNKYAILASQALQRCSATVRIVHTIRRIWRRMAKILRVLAVHCRGHSGDPRH